MLAVWSDPRSFTGANVPAIVLCWNTLRHRVDTVHFVAVDTGAGAVWAHIIVGGTQTT